MECRRRIPSPMKPSRKGFRSYSEIMSRDGQPPTDDPLVARIRAGDGDALAEFIVARQPQLMAFIDRRLGAALRRKVEPDDLFQETSAEAVRSLAEIQLGDRDPFNWLCQVA